MRIFVLLCMIGDKVFLNPCLGCGRDMKKKGIINAFSFFLFVNFLLPSLRGGKDGDILYITCPLYHPFNLRITPLPALEHIREEKQAFRSVIHAQSSP